MKSRSQISFLMTALWLLLLGHCMSEQTTAHWHVAPGKQAEHHHHPISGDHDHDATPEPLGGHSHDDSQIDCCKLLAYARPAAQTEDNLSLKLPPQVPTIDMLALILTEAVEPVTLVAPVREAPDPFSDLTFLSRSNLIPNGPPSLG